LRAQLTLAAAAGTATTAIAQRFRLRPATVSQWRRRFAAQRTGWLAGSPPARSAVALRCRGGAAHLGLARSAAPLRVMPVGAAAWSPEPWVMCQQWWSRVAGSSALMGAAQCCGRREDLPSDIGLSLTTSALSRTFS